MKHKNKFKDRICLLVAKSMVECFVFFCMLLYTLNDSNRWHRSENYIFHYGIYGICSKFCSLTKCTISIIYFVRGQKIDKTVDKKSHSNYMVKQIKKYGTHKMFEKKKIMQLCEKNYRKDTHKVSGNRRPGENRSNSRIFSG